MASHSGFVQDCSDRTLEKTRATKNVIEVFTGNPPKDYEHIYDVKTLIEKFPHPNGTCNSASIHIHSTTPVGYGDVWQKMTDWHQLSEGEQCSVKAFLTERFSVEDLELAYDEYYPKFGRHPSVHDFRVFILNWEAQMKADLEVKDTNIEQLANRENNLKIALDFAVNNSVSQQEQIDTLVRENGVLQEEVDQVTTAKDQLCQSNSQLVQENRQLSDNKNNVERVLAQQKRVNSHLRRDVEQQKTVCGELKTKNKQLCNEISQKDDTISTLQTENTQLHTENTQKDDTISTLQTENTQKDDTISTLKTENTHKNKKVSNLKKDNVLLRQKLKETTELCERKDMQMKIQKMKEDELLYQMSETSERIARLEKVNEDKCEENMQQAQHIRAQDKTISDLRTRLQEQENINKDLYSQIAELRQLVLQQIEHVEAAET